MSEPGIVIEQQLRWGDMDALGHVNNTVYFRFCESARIAYFEALDPSRFASKAAEGPGLVAANLNFRRQMKYPGRVRIKANVSRIGRKSFHLEYSLRDCADDVVVADGSSVCVWVDYDASKALSLPDELIHAIRNIEQDDKLGQG